MATRITSICNHPRSGADVHRAVTSREYWIARVAELEGDAAVLRSFTADGTSTRVSVSKPMPPDRLPPQAVVLRPSGVRIDFEESWGQFEDGEALGEMTAVVSGAPVTISAKLTLRGDDSRCDIEFEGAVNVRVPLLGKLIEASIVRDVERDVHMIAAYTSKWLDRESEGTLP